MFDIKVVMYTIKSGMDGYASYMLLYVIICVFHKKVQIPPGLKKNADVMKLWNFVR